MLVTELNAIYINVKGERQKKSVSRVSDQIIIIIIIFLLNTISTHEMNVKMKTKSQIMGRCDNTDCTAEQRLTLTAHSVIFAQHFVSSLTLVNRGQMG